MKFIANLLFSTLIACAALKGYAQEATKVASVELAGVGGIVIATEIDHGRTLRLNQGQTLMVRLESHRDGGYRWRQAFTQLGRAIQSDDFSSCAPGVVGCSGYEIFSWNDIRATPGIYQVVLDEIRFDNAVTQTFQLNIEVTGLNPGSDYQLDGFGYELLTKVDIAERSTGQIRIPAGLRSVTRYILTTSSPCNIISSSVIATNQFAPTRLVKTYRIGARGNGYVYSVNADYGAQLDAIHVNMGRVAGPIITDICEVRVYASYDAPWNML